MLVVRVHPEFLEKQRIPRELVGKNIWKERFEDIRNYEKYLTRNGVAIRKFFLNVSNGEQQKRFLARIDDPDKNWKMSSNDAKARGYWDDYMKAYEDLIRETVDEGRSVVRRPCRQQVVYASSRGGRHHRGALVSWPRLPGGWRRKAEGTGRDEEDTDDEEDNEKEEIIMTEKRSTAFFAASRSIQLG